MFALWFWFMFRWDKVFVDHVVLVSFFFFSLMVWCVDGILALHVVTYVAQVLKNLILALLLLLCGIWQQINKLSKENNPCRYIISSENCNPNFKGITVSVLLMCAMIKNWAIKYQKILGVLIRCSVFPVFRSASLYHVSYLIMLKVNAF